jgi:hypothetical protein
VQDPQREVVVVVEGLGQERVLRAAVGEAVDAPVGPQQRLVVLRADGLELGDQLLGL